MNNIEVTDMGNCILVRPYMDNAYTTVEEVIKAWNQGVTFSTPHEPTSCMNKMDFIKYGNKLDGIVYVDIHGLNVTLKSPII